MQRAVDNVLAVTKESVKTITYESLNNIVRFINGVSALILVVMPGKTSILEGMQGWILRPTFENPGFIVGWKMVFRPSVSSFMNFQWTLIRALVWIIHQENTILMMMTLLQLHYLKVLEPQEQAALAGMKGTGEIGCFGSDTYWHG